MILKMTAVTLLYVLLTVFLWERTKNKKLSPALRIGIGLVYGICSILSTHFGVDYGHMLLNVRDIGPLAAGLFFDPLSGLISGLIGGIERYIAGTYWGIGSYTRIACGISTCLAGLISVFMNKMIFRGKRPASTAAFFMGAVMEVFHMYVIFITHRNDMKMAYYVVRNCALPMIIFTGIGLSASSVIIKIREGEWQNPFRPQRKEDVSLSTSFQFWLFLVFTIVTGVNFLFSYTIQSQTAKQQSLATLTEDSNAIRSSYEKIRQARGGILNAAGKSALKAAGSIADSVEKAGGFDALDPEFAKEMLLLYEIQAVSIFSPDMDSSLTAGTPSLCQDLFPDSTGSASKSMIRQLDNGMIAAAVENIHGKFQTVINAEKLAADLNLGGLNEALSELKIGQEGSFDIFDENGNILAGNHIWTSVPEADLQTILSQKTDSTFEMKIRGEDSLCRKLILRNGEIMIASLPLSEIYADRDTGIIETAFADILLMTVIYVLISLLVERTVVDNLSLVNRSLTKITDGDLNETVNVRGSAEFSNLSDDINKTVSALKGYIDAAEKKMEEELILAKTIQESALPHNFSFPRHEFELYALMDPAKEVGGDFYDFFFVDKNKIALVIADVSGKGIPASLFMMRSKTAIRNFAETGISPAEIFYKVNNTLCDGNDAEMFVTAWIGIIDLTTGSMICANAGHEYPVLMRAGKEYEILRDKHSLALAAMPEIRAKEYEIQLYPGDKLFVFTDGVPEAINEEVEAYGSSRLTAILNKLKNEDEKETLLSVQKDLKEFTGKAVQFDDITMLGFWYKGA